MSRPGTVIDAVDIARGCISVEANDVTIKRSRVRGGLCGNYQIRVSDAVSELVIQDSELDGGDLNAGSAGVGGGGAYTCRRCNVHNVGNGFFASGPHPVVIEDSYVHDLYIRNDLGSHNQDVYINGTTAGVTVRHNNLENSDGQTAAVLIDASWGGPIAHVTEEDNLFNGGGYEVYGGAPNEVSYIVITKNRFGRKFFPTGGRWGPSANIACGGLGNLWSGNVWDDTNDGVGPASQTGRTSC